MSHPREALAELAPWSQGASAASPAADFLLLSTVASAATPFVTGGRDIPWRVRLQEGALLVSVATFHDTDPNNVANRDLVLLCGAVIENLRIALHHRGRACSIRLFPDPADVSLLASIRPAGLMRLHTEDKVLQSLLPPRAHPHAVHHRTGLLSPALLAVYQHAVRCTGACLDIVSDDRRRKILGDLASEAESAVRYAPARHGTDLQPERRDRRAEAIPQPAPDAFAELLGSLGGRIRARIDAGQSPPGSAREQIVEAPVLGVLATPGDGAANWIMAGRALQRLLLHAAAQSMSATIFELPIEGPGMRDAVKSLLVSTGTPQAILRLDFDEHEPGVAQPMASAVYH